MTVQAAVARTDLLYPNSVPFSEKARWLSELDEMLAEGVFSAYSDTAAQSGPARACGEGELLIKAPYDGIYIPYLAMHCGHAEGDIAKYNSCAAVFNAGLENFLNVYNRSRTAKNEKIRI